MKTIIEIEKEEQERILAGVTYFRPGETERARRESFYCSMPDVRACIECALVNYGLDCHNNKIEN